MDQTSHDDQVGSAEINEPQLRQIEESQFGTLRFSGVDNKFLKLQKQFSGLDKKFERFERKF